MSTQEPKTQTEEKSLANKAIELIINDCELVHDQQKGPYAIVNSAGVRKIYGINGKSFNEFIASKYYKAKKFALSDTAIKAAISTLTGKAIHEGRAITTYTRIAKNDAGYWLDLCNDKWEAVCINKTGWTVLSGDTVPFFCRTNSMQAIPVPVGGGTLDALWDLANIPAHQRLIVVAWLLECLRDDTPHVVMELVGEQGSAKSTTQRLLRMLIDPNVANLRAAPKKVEDVWVCASNSHLVSLENISHLGQDYQDALSVLATGGAYATRTLYTNKEEVIMELRKPIIVNGITVNVTAQDLLDRSLHIELPLIKSRLQSTDVAHTFSDQYAHIVGALLDQFVRALRLIDSIKIDDGDKPRMVDFAHLGEAVFQSNGQPNGTFLAAYKSMRQKGVHRTIDASPVGQAMLAYLDANPQGWSGRLIDLLAQLSQLKQPGESNWPKSAKGLGDSLRRLAPALRTLGYDCKSQQKTAGTILWEIRPSPTKVQSQCPASPASPASPESSSDLDHDPSVSSGHEGHEGHEHHSLRAASTVLQ
jgi:hypothetical protein